MRSQLHNTREPQREVVTERTRLTILHTKRRTGALGLPEIAALGVAALLLFAAIAAYFLYLVPQRQRLVALGQEREQLEKRLHDANQVEQKNKDTNTIIADIISSLDKFETGTLAERDASSTAIIQELNEKTARNGLARAQFSFIHQEEMTAEQLQQQQQQLAAGIIGGDAAVRQRQQRQSVFPGIDISLTVEGSYASLRRFIHDIETSRRFIVVNGVELEGVTDASASRAAESSVSRGQLVSLRLDMSAYFRRADVNMGGTTAHGDGTSQ
jgi:Tfp pilus assembly protein PilO